MTTDDNATGLRELLEQERVRLRAMGLALGDFGRLAGAREDETAAEAIQRVVAERDQERAGFRFAEKQNALLRAERDKAEVKLSDIGYGEEGPDSWRCDQATQEHMRGLIAEAADLRARLARAEQEAAELRESRFAWAFEADRLETVRRKAVGEWMDTDRDCRRLRAEVVGDLHALADRDEVTTGDIHSLADEIEGGDWLGNQPAGPDQKIQVNQALRARVQTDEWCHAEPADPPIWYGPDLVAEAGLKHVDEATRVEVLAAFDAAAPAPAAQPEPPGEQFEPVVHADTGHRWAESLGGFGPVVCVRCLSRSDSPDANYPCDPIVERLQQRETERT